MLQCGACEVIAELTIINAKCTPNTKEVHPAINRLLTSHQEVFKEPQKLPPKRECDHVINLVPGAQPFNLRPYIFF